MWSRRVWRTFAGGRKHDPEVRKKIWHQAKMYTAVAGVTVLAYQGIQFFRDPPASRSRRVTELSDLAAAATEYTGFPRPSDAEEVLSKLQHSVVILYHPEASGKSQLVAYIRATAQRPVLVVHGKKDILELVNQFPLKTPLSKCYSDDPNISTFLETIGKGLTPLADRNPILVLDGFEKCEEVYARRLAMLAHQVKATRKGSALVVTSSMASVAILKNCTGGDVTVHVLRDLTRSEYQSLATHLSIPSKVADFIYDECGPSVSLLLAIQNHTSPSDYIKKVKSDLRDTIAEAVRAKESLRPELERALLTVTAEKPYGDVFAGSAGARTLIQHQFAAEFPSDSVHFRHKLAISALQEALGNK